MSRSDFHNNIKDFRKQKGYTQKQLADLVGVTKNTISSIETGVFLPGAYLALRLCNAFGCKFEELFFIQ